MGHIRLTASLILLALMTQAVLAAPFQNLDFEQSAVVDLPGGGLDPVAAFPHWTLTVNDNPVSRLPGNGVIVALDSAYIALIPAFPAVSPIGGNFSAELSALGFVTPASASIAQSGDIPADAKSVVFQIRPALAVPGLSIDGSDIPIFPMSSAGGSTLWGGDISAFTSANHQLAFNATGNYFDLDNISFSARSLAELGVPEPASLWLFAPLALLFFRQRKRQNPA